MKSPCFFLTSDEGPGKEMLLVLVILQRGHLGENLLCNLGLQVTSLETNLRGKRIVEDIKEDY